MTRLSVFGFLLSAMLFVSTAPIPAKAAQCRDFSFTVNDYGKEGPTNDAKRLVRVTIDKWMKKHNISNYKIKPQGVGCYLFLDFGFFDEHTCTAKAKGCW